MKTYVLVLVLLLLVPQGQAHGGEEIFHEETVYFEGSGRQDLVIDVPVGDHYTPEDDRCVTSIIGVLINVTEVVNRSFILVYFLDETETPNPDPSGYIDAPTDSTQVQIFGPNSPDNTSEGGIFLNHPIRGGDPDLFAISVYYNGSSSGELAFKVVMADVGYVEDDCADGTGPLKLSTLLIAPIFVFLVIKTRKKFH